ncbi:unnamed protein product [Rhodiola kirilowii]
MVYHPRSTQFHQVIVIITILLSLSFKECKKATQSEGWYNAINCRKHTAVLSDFGAKGDGKTSNTKAFRSAVEHLSRFSSDGGAQLIVPAGKWLTGSFNLTSHFTLFLEKDAVILASKEQDISEWPILPALPSYGRGRDEKDGRYASLIFGNDLEDVVITGNNGTINGQGPFWWDKFHKKELKHTRPYLIEIMNSHMVQISNLTLIDAPSWNVHPVYSRDIIIQGLTILAPTNSPNTDGINPDSCSNVRIEDNYIVSGDDCIAIKSGWDQYGIKYGKPTEHLTIKRLTCISPKSATIAIGSEMSGGVRDIRAEDITALDTESGVRIKTAKGRGAYVKDIFVKGMVMKGMKYVFWMTGDYGDHPDKGYDPEAIPVVEGISYKDVVAEEVNMPGRLVGIEGHGFKDICISNVKIELAKKHKKVSWNCTDVGGVWNNVTPEPCPMFRKDDVECPFPVDKLPIENVELKKCSYGT